MIRHESNTDTVAANSLMSMITGKLLYAPMKRKKKKKIKKKLAIYCVVHSGKPIVTPPITFVILIFSSTRGF